MSITHNARVHVQAKLTWTIAQMEMYIDIYVGKTVFFAFTHRAELKPSRFCRRCYFTQA
jgi:hypothetical protein